MFCGYTEIDIIVLFTLNGNDKGLRGHSKDICKPRYNTDIRKYFFSNWVIDRRNSLDEDTADAPSLNCLKNRLNTIRCTRMGFLMDWSAKPQALSCPYVGWPQDKAAQDKHWLCSNEFLVCFVRWSVVELVKLVWLLGLVRLRNSTSNSTLLRRSMVRRLRHRYRDVLSGTLWSVTWRLSHCLTRITSFTLCPWKELSKMYDTRR